MYFVKALAAVAVGSHIALAIPTPQDDIEGTPQLGDNDTSATCSLSARDPKSWSESGAEQLVGGWIVGRDEREDHWLLALDQRNNGDASAIACATIGGTGCSTPQAACETFSNPAYYFVLTMAARVNEFFNVAHRKLTSSTVKDILQISSIAKDFELPNPTDSGLADVFSRTSSALSLAGALLGPAGGGITGSMGLISGIMGLAGGLQEKPKIPDYASLSKEMEKYLQNVFDKSEDIMERALKSLFGEGNKDDTILNELLEMLSKMGVEGFGGDYDSAVTKLLNGGGFIVPAPQSDIVEAFDKGFKTIRHGMIGNFLAGLQVFVQRDETTKEGDCKLEKGKYWDGGNCNSLVYKEKNGEAKREVKAFSDDYYKKFGEYGLSIEALIRNAIDCNNGKPDDSTPNFTGEYPKCYFGLPYANFREGKHWKRCQTNYVNWESVPRWLLGYTGFSGDECNEYSLIGGGNCVVNSQVKNSWTEWGLRRYRTHFSADGADIKGICEWFNHDRCLGYSNVQCWEADGGVLADISYVDGPAGKEQNDNCQSKARDDYARHLNCRV